VLFRLLNAHLNLQIRDNEHPPPVTQHESKRFPAPRRARIAVSIFREPPFLPTEWYQCEAYVVYDWLMLYDTDGSRCRLPRYEHDMCWGLTIVRVSYKDNKMFARAVQAIRRLSLVRLAIKNDTWAKRYMKKENQPPRLLPAN
jgi:hypothetical protein